MSAPLVEIRDLRIERNGATVLDVPRLDLVEGRIISLIGPNGAGKSTLLLWIMRLLKGDSGVIRHRGEEVTEGAAARRFRRRMSMVFQESLLFSTTVYRNIASGPRMRGMDRAAVRHAVERSMELFGIAHLARRHARALSGGEAQRVNLARALALGPEILLMDEPFSSLDAPTRESLIDDLERIVREGKITLLFATHDRGEAIRLSDEIIVMNRGRVVQADTPGRITQFPADEFVASFMGTETNLSGTVAASSGGVLSLTVNGAAVEAVGEIEPGRQVAFCIHPENIVFSEGPSESSARNSFRGRVTRVVPMGLYQKVYFDCGFTLVAFVSNLSTGELDIRPGRELTASFKATSVHIIRTWR